MNYSGDQINNIYSNFNDRKLSGNFSTLNYVRMKQNQQLCSSLCSKLLLMIMKETRKQNQPFNRQLHKNMFVFHICFNSKQNCSSTHRKSSSLHTYWHSGLNYSKKLKISKILQVWKVFVFQLILGHIYSLPKSLLQSVLPLSRQRYCEGHLPCLLLSLQKKLLHAKKYIYWFNNSLDIYTTSVRVCLVVLKERVVSQMLNKDQPSICRNENQRYKI